MEEWGRGERGEVAGGSGEVGWKAMEVGGWVNTASWVRMKIIMWIERTTPR